jgi:hypothetical protein
MDQELFPESSLPALLSPWMVNGTLADYTKSEEYAIESDLFRFVSLFVGFYIACWFSHVTTLKLQEIADGLLYLHNNDVTHGDVKDVG